MIYDVQLKSWRCCASHQYRNHVESEVSDSFLHADHYVDVERAVAFGTGTVECLDELGKLEEPNGGGGVHKSLVEQGS